MNPIRIVTKDTPITSELPKKAAAGTSFAMRSGTSTKHEAIYFVIQFHSPAKLHRISWFSIGPKVDKKLAAAASKLFLHAPVKFGGPSPCKLRDTGPSVATKGLALMGGGTNLNQ